MKPTTIWHAVRREVHAACRSLRYDLSRHRPRRSAAALARGGAPTYRAYLRRPPGLRVTALIAVMVIGGVAGTYAGVLGSMSALSAGDGGATDTPAGAHGATDAPAGDRPTPGGAPVSGLGKAPDPAAGTSRPGSPEAPLPPADRPQPDISGDPASPTGPGTPGSPGHPSGPPAPTTPGPSGPPGGSPSAGPTATNAPPTPTDPSPTCSCPSPTPAGDRTS